MPSVSTSRVPTEQEVIGYLASQSNWGRWGAEDELGTLNLITPAKRVAAARLVRDGVGVTCARPVASDLTAKGGETLFVRTENAPAIGLYESIGMERVLAYRSILFP